MESLHDRFFSDINKNHIFNLVCNLIETNYTDTSVRTNDYFKKTYEKNMKDAFERTDTDDIVVLNRKLLDSQIKHYQTSYLNSLQNSQQVKEEAPQKYTESKPPELTPLVFHGVNKVFQEDTSLYTLNFETKPGTLYLQSITLPQEKNLIFAGPFIIVSVNKIDLLCKLESTKEMGKRTYLEFIPVAKEYLTVSTTVNIEIKNICGETFHKKDSLLGRRNPPQKRDEHEIFIKDHTYQVDDVLKINNELYSIISCQEELIGLKDGDYSQIDTESSVMNISEQPICVFYSVSNS
tara:strand:- start:3810 stop:4688 length:879 start_codon:yes stop_codon:yes gene_type:complete